MRNTASLGFGLIVCATIALGACTAQTASENSQDPGMAQDPGVGLDRQEVEAPIERVELVTRETLPPGYALHVVSGLPSGCAAFERIDVGHHATRIDLTVLNTMPTDQNVVCTMIYGTAENTVELDHLDLQSGQNYTVYANGQMMFSFSPE